MAQLWATHLQSNSHVQQTDMAGGGADMPEVVPKSFVIWKWFVLAHFSFIILVSKPPVLF